MRTSELMMKIELLREEMISTGMSKGLTSPETIQLSEKLDMLLNLAMEFRKPLNEIRAC